MKSMTGYGRGESTVCGKKTVLEIKAVNHRYNEINIKMPKIMFPFEDELKKYIRERVQRGKVDVFVTYTSLTDEDVSISVNTSLADAYVNALDTIKERYKLSDKLSLRTIASFPDVITIENDVLSDETTQNIKCSLMGAASQALEEFVAMRKREGENLQNNISEKLDILEKYVGEVTLRAPLVAQDYKKRLTEMLENFENAEFDESRILTEVLIFSDKACIDEEITRMNSHICQMRDIIKEDVPVGRKLDFLVQEMVRETNTMGSKSNDITITNIVVNMKSEIEKIREQIQNIE
ncbi:MAG: YicC family protein [Firmicutes bacterium]|nr:YicC family protein [Bacillota bacterium]